MNKKIYILQRLNGEKSIVNLDDVSAVHTADISDPHTYNANGVYTYGTLVINFKNGTTFKCEVTNVFQKMDEIAHLLNSDLDDLRKDNESLKQKLKRAEEASAAGIREAIAETLIIRGRRGRQGMDKPYIMAYGRQYTIEQVLQEVKQNSRLGKDIVQDLNMLTIDKLLRGKEQIKREDV